MEKEQLKNFPVWNPQFGTWSKIKCSDKKVAFKTFRNSSSGFIQKRLVRDNIFEKDNYTCKYCKSKSNLTIDHIKSVIHCFNNDLIKYCNTKENLQTLCKSCNSAKLP